MVRLVCAFALVAVVVGCSSSSETFTDCKIGELRGTWRVSYTQTNGSCGPVADETAVLTPGKDDPAVAQCTAVSNQISPDKCRMETDSTCPLTGENATQRWVGVMRQTGPGSLAGSMTLTVQGSVACRSTYDVNWTQQ